MVSDEQIKRLQFKIAEVLGWTHLEDRMGALWGHHPNWKGAHPLSDMLAVPNWPTDRRRSYELPVKLKGMFRKAYKTLDVKYSEILAEHPLDPAWFECLVWLLYKGWRRVNCERNTVDVCDNENHDLPCKITHHCPNRLCEGGEWVKDSP